MERMTDRQMATLVANAHQAGMAAGEGANPTPMTVVGGVPGQIKQRYYVPEGACGFAWINIYPGTSRFAKYMKRAGGARSAYQGGVNVWVGEFGQSVDRKAAYAGAYAAVLKAAGVNCYADNRMD